MRKLIVLALVGLGAQLVDGSLGMGYGVTSSTLLLLAGLTPAAASASVHISASSAPTSPPACPTGGSRTSTGGSWPGSPDRARSARSSAPPCCPQLSTEAATPIMSVILLLLGVYILVRFVARHPAGRLKKALTLKFLAPLGLFAGFIDATGGGGWGPVATPALLADGRLEPRKVIGIGRHPEFAVSAAASLGFLIGLGAAGINWGFAVGPAGRRSDRRPARRVPGPDRSGAPARGRGRRHRSCSPTRGRC